MTIQDIGLLQAIGAKMDYLSQRQNIFAQNISNADTPGYQPKDLAPVDFSSFLNDDKKNVSNVHLAATDSQHLNLNGTTANLKTKENNTPYEVSPSGNAVILEEQLMKSGRNAMDYTLMLNVYQKQIGMFNIALDGN